MARQFSVPFLGKIPIDPALAASGDLGKPFAKYAADSPTAKAMNAAFEPILQTTNNNPKDMETKRL
jgi:ATP-binding protein involved in chromosome partitioning